jgi:SNF2 family DNA or RNA helicase
MESIQYTFDFDAPSVSSPFYDYVYLDSKRHFGLGKIVSFSGKIIKVQFSGVEEELTFSTDDPDVVPFKLSIDSLFKTESHTCEMVLSLSALELKLAHTFDKLSSLSNSRTRLLPHQLESTYIVVNSLKPRFILADEVGLGKTIEAALIMKELIFRNNFKRILIVCPSPLQIQWQQELKNKFNETFEIVRRRNFITNGPDNWQNFSRVITSIDFIKNPRYSTEILKKKWDIVIFDEAHRLRRDYSKITRSYLFAERISKKCEALLLLTATPFRGKLEELFYLVHLVDPNILGPYHTFINDYVIGNRSDLKDKVSKVLLRRRKVEVGGFTKRFAKTVKIDLSEVERQFYDETTDYVKREYNLALRTKNRAIGFVMVVFQKLLDSSVFALIQALMKRKFLLESRLHKFHVLTPVIDEWDLDETENVEDFISSLDEATGEDLNSIRRELLTLNRLILLGRSIKEDKKSIKLRETLIRLKKEGNKKFIIFTQFRTTQDYLYSVLSPDFTTTLFHGSLSMEAKERAIEEFKSRTEILICTEAGGEGRNLQFTNFLFNYDLPWSPLKIEQRIGRIHRFGQKDNVYIFNFASKDTVAERILEVLTNKIRLFEESIGVSDTLLGTIEDELDFNSSLMKFVTGGKTKEELEQEIDSRIKIAEIGYKKLDSLLTPKLVDFNLQDYYNHTLSERSFDNSHLEDFILKYCKFYNDSSEINLLAYQDKIYKMGLGKEPKFATFDSEIALKDDNLEFLAFGHAMVEKSITYFIENKMGYCTKLLSSPDLLGKAFFIFLSHFQFSLSRSEIYYYEYDFASNTVVRVNNLPCKDFLFQKDFTVDNGIKYPDKTAIEAALIRVSEQVEIDTEVHKEKLFEKTKSLFLREEYKMELTNQKTLRELHEKLDRQEAQLKWNLKPEKKSALSRTKNEILRKREEHELELRKIRNGSNINKKIELFQLYIGPVLFSH